MSFNIYSNFKKLLEPSARYTVEVVSVSSDGTSQVRTNGGVTLTVSGDTVPAGSRAYIRDGVIISKAPNITTTRVDI